ncbi:MULTISPECIES: RNA methyltransferase [unclassified Desulfovibrio]|uniref:TrmH family RNA methyltransferase n=1 Tax=unclassified Desulfovibrio TaxID=2593640 RepID=UPI000F5E4012|nr:MULTISPECIES: RNA methyltransferase [unclassified Desulfovibrio]RRD70603.1 RNA methyltransferase [Desulfovibrio sp. OH1209_COT-279]RRD87032.1 RNA methyltransferase [Desulfovibrio sp. OH1186_COT-070]
MHDSSSDISLLPGLKPVLELLGSDPRRIDCVFCKKGLRGPDAHAIQTLCRQHGVRLNLVDQVFLDRLCAPACGQGHRHAVAHQGVAARLAATEFCGLEQMLDAVRHAPLPVIVAFDQVQDPGNVGTLCRTLYALGGAGILLPLHNSAYLGPAARRAAAGALERLPVARVTNLAHALDSAEEAGLTIYGTGAPNCPGAQDIFAEPMLLPAVLVLGNENKGLRPGVAKRCARMLHIPLARAFDSLNVAQAGAVLLGLAAARAGTPPTIF